MTEILCEYEACRKPFTPKRKGQRFHAARCRSLWHQTNARVQGITGTAVSVRLLKAGKTSMTIHFNASDRSRVSTFNQGQKVKVSD